MRLHKLGRNSLADSVSRDAQRYGSVAEKAIPSVYICMHSGGGGMGIGDRGARNMLKQILRAPCKKKYT